MFSDLEQDTYSSKHMDLNARKQESSGVGEQQRRKPACASMQSDQRLCYIRLLESIISRLATSEVSFF